MTSSRRLERLLQASDDADYDDESPAVEAIWDDTEPRLPDGERWTTFDRPGVALGPEPRPGWLVTTGAAHDVDLGVLKTGKEADVFLVHRFDADAACLLAAKRYRPREHRQFTRDGAYTAGRRVRRSREMRALRTGTAFGRELQAGLWAQAEWRTLVELYEQGFPVPYPVSYDGGELLMEFIGDDEGAAASRLAPLRPTVAELASLYEQARDVILRLAARGEAHGDLSPYNCLVDADRLVVIDWPQLVDVVANPEGMAFLRRDVLTMCGWFVARGLDIDAEELFAEAVASL